MFLWGDLANQVSRMVENVFSSGCSKSASFFTHTHQFAEDCARCLGCVRCMRAHSHLYFVFHLFVGGRDDLGGGLRYQPRSALRGRRLDLFSMHFAGDGVRNRTLHAGDFRRWELMKRFLPRRQYNLTAELAGHKLVHR